jgi:hypothetical protein
MIMSVWRGLRLAGVRAAALRPVGRAVSMALPSSSSSGIAAVAAARSQFVAPARTYTSEREYKSTKLDALEYHRRVDTSLEELADQFDELLETVDIDAREAAMGKSAASDWDVEYAVCVRMNLTQTGVINLRLGSYGTYVINKQPPSQQLWLSSPRRCVVHRHDTDRTAAQSALTLTRHMMPGSPTRTASCTSLTSCSRPSCATYSTRPSTSIYRIHVV